MPNEHFVILLVEDDDGHASLVQRNLRRAGINNDIIHVRDGQEALDFIFAQGVHEERGEAPLLLVLDINLPRVDGIEVLRQIKANPETASFPVIMLTTTDEPKEIQQCYQLGCSIYITKPVAYDEFAEAIKRLGLFLSIVRVPAADSCLKS